MSCTEETLEGFVAVEDAVDDDAAVSMFDLLLLGNKLYFHHSAVASLRSWQLKKKLYVKD